MPRIPEPSINEKQFLLKALQENIRVDGRNLNDYRKIDLKFGEEYGVADISLGKTRSISQFVNKTDTSKLTKSPESSSKYPPK